jgi:hypothetical protein
VKIGNRSSSNIKVREKKRNQQRVSHGTVSVIEKGNKVGGVSKQTKCTDRLSKMEIKNRSLALLMWVQF